MRRQITHLFFHMSEAVGVRVIEAIHSLGASMIFVSQVTAKFKTIKHRLRLVFEQMEFVGNQSFMIICICGFFIGAALSLQVGEIFTIFGAQSVLGAANGKALARELSPLISGFLMAGRVGASMTAEIATMRVNEQIDAMEAMAVDPLSYIAVPRVIASILMLPLLVAIFNVVGQFASFIVALTVFDIDQGTFFSKMTQIVNIGDVFSGLQKAVIFGGVIALVACWFGLRASGGAKGVGRATTNSVVASLLILLLIDLVMTYFQTVV